MEAARSLAAHRMRTLLSALGILFGVAAVIGILSIGEGARREQEELIAELGVLNFQVKKKDLPEDTRKAADIVRVTRGLSGRDVTMLRDALPDAVYVGGLRELKGLELVPRPDKPDALRVVGVDVEHLAGTPFVRTEGRSLRTADAERAAPVCLLGSRAREELFGAEPAVGARVRVGTLWLTVVGVVSMGEGGERSVAGVDLQDRSGDIMLPLNTARVHFPVSDAAPELDEVQVTVREIDAVRPTTAVAGRALARLHRDQPVFELIVPLRLLEQSREQQRLFNLVMGMIAGISLLVGGIGIMNIMLASVLERTREIAVRMAVGASPRDIHRLFLVEASLISLVGGALGIAVGFGISGLVAAFAGWRTAVSPEAILLATVLSTLEGVVFGYLPARRAASLPPALAVRAG